MSAQCLHKGDPKARQEERLAGPGQEIGDDEKKKSEL